MIDFDVFKKKMLAAKLGMVDATSSQNAAGAVAGAAFQKEWNKDEWVNYQAMWNEDLNSKENGWKLKINQAEYKNGFKSTMYQRKSHSSKVDTIRINAFFQNVTHE